MAETSIEWTDKVWNPTRGCSRVSTGCENCYAERMAARFSGPGLPFEGLATRGKNGPRWTGKVRLVEDNLPDPLRWKTPSRIFVNSVSDLFHDEIPFEYIAAVFGVMAACPRHTFQVLTKRPERMVEFFRWVESQAGVPPTAFVEIMAANLCDVDQLNPPWPLPNVWLGVSVETHGLAYDRIPLLMQTPAAVRFLSCEPLLSPLMIHPSLATGSIHWVIAGGESGPGARECPVSRIRSLVRQCELAGVPVFVKQLGSNATLDGKPLTLTGKGGDTSEWPPELIDINIRQFPRIS